jgi:hypothetical protein
MTSTEVLLSTAVSAGIAARSPISSSGSLTMLPLSSIFVRRQLRAEMLILSRDFIF